MHPEREEGQQIELLRAGLESLRADRARLDWLADPGNTFGAVHLPKQVARRAGLDLRSAIDLAMQMDSRQLSPTAAGN